MPIQYIPLFECKDGAPVASVEPGYYVVTAVTPDGETPFCAPSLVGTPPAPVPPTPPTPPTPPPLVCVNTFLLNTTPFVSDFSWDAYPDATGYNVYLANDATPTTFALAYANIPVTILPLVCQHAVVTAITPQGETPRDCTPVHFCNSQLGPCGQITMDPSLLLPWAWFKADSFAPSTPDATDIGGVGVEWVDQSGNGRNAVTNGADPKYYANTFGTMPGISFSGASTGGGGGATRLRIPVFAGSGEFTVVVVNRFMSGAQPTGPMLGSNNGNAGTWSLLRSGSHMITTTTSGQITSTELCSSINPTTCLTFRRDASNVLSFWENTLDRSPVLTEGGALNSELIGAVQTFAFYTWFVGWIGEILVFDRFINNPSLVNLVEGYLRPRWCFTDCQQ